MCIYIYIYIYITIIWVINNNNIPLCSFSWGLPNHQMVYYICSYLKRKEHIFTNSIMRITFYLFLKHFSVNLCMWQHLETSSSRLFNKYTELALATSNFSHKHKSHFLIPQMYGCAFIAINRSIV